MQPGCFCWFDEQACLVCANMISWCYKMAEGWKMFLLCCKIQLLGGPVGGCPTLRQSSCLHPSNSLSSFSTYCSPPKWPFKLASLTFLSLRKRQKWLFKSQEAGCVRWMKAWGGQAESLNGGGWGREALWWGEEKVTRFVVCEMQPLTGCLIWELSHLFSHEWGRAEQL